MRPNGSKGRGGYGSRVWKKRKAPAFAGADYEICRWRYFLNVKKVTKERRVFAVGDPARRSRDGNGKIAAPAGPVTGQPGFAAGEMRPNGSKGRGRSVRLKNHDFKFRIKS